MKPSLSHTIISTQPVSAHLYPYPLHLDYFEANLRQRIISSSNTSVCILQRIRKKNCEWNQSHWVETAQISIKYEK